MCQEHHNHLLHKVCLLDPMQGSSRLWQLLGVQVYVNNFCDTLFLVPGLETCNNCTILLRISFPHTRHARSTSAPALTCLLIAVPVKPFQSIGNQSWLQTWRLSVGEVRCVRMQIAEIHAHVDPNQPKNPLW
jgi:hypothetical protein